VKDSLTKALEDAEAQLKRYAGVNRGPNGEPSILEVFYEGEIAACRSKWRRPASTTGCRFTSW